MSEGYHFIVGRDDAKQVFAHDAAGMQSMLAEWRSDAAREANRLAFDSGWQAWSDCFDALSSAAEANELLKFVFLGGRPLPETPGDTIRLIRPDMVPHIATTLKQVDREAVSSLGDEAASKLDQLAALFDSAAEQRGAVLFHAPAAN